MRIPSALLIGVTVAVLGCDSSVEPEDDRFTLATINGSALPGPYPDPQGCCTALEVTAGSLTLKLDGTFRHVLEVRCRSDLPAGSECEITGDGTRVATGSYSRAEGHLDFDGGARYNATFTGDRVTLEIAVPPSAGFYFPRFELSYRAD